MVVIFEVIAVSVSSISFINCECLNALSNRVKLFVLKLFTVVFTLDIRVSCVFVVFFELYVNEIPSRNFVYSGSTITGVIDATV